MIRILVLTMLLVLQSSALLAADVQKWTDSSGKVHYGTRPPADNKAEVVDNKVSVFTASVSKPDVVLYSTSRCGYCKKARAFMRREGIKYQEYDIEKDSLASKRHRSMGASGVPFLVKGSDTVQGFSASRYRSFFRL